MTPLSPMLGLFLIFTFLGRVLSATIPYRNTTDDVDRTIIDIDPPLDNEAFINEMVESAGYCAISYCLSNGNLEEGSLTNACPIALCFESEGIKTVLQMFTRDVSGYVLQDDTQKEIVVTFKGTTTGKEWDIDFDTESVPYVPYTVAKGANVVDFSCEDCKVHKGFHGANKVFMEEAFPLVQQLHDDYPEYRVKVTGHSLGAALALLAANELRLLDIDVTLITYAGPKIGNYWLSRWSDELWDTDGIVSQLKEGNGGGRFPQNCYIRVTNNGDIVPLTPLITMGYDHSGCEIRLGRNDQVKIRGKWRRVNEARELTHLSKVVLKLVQQRKWDRALARKDVSERHGNYFVRLNQCK